MDILKKYFYGHLSAQDEQKVKDWLAKHGDEPEVIAILEELISEQEIEDLESSTKAFNVVKNKLGLRKSHSSIIVKKAVRWISYAAILVLLPFLGAKGYTYFTPPIEWIELKVPTGQTEELFLSDGTHLYLNAGSRITYPSAFRGKERKVFVEGEVFAEVTKNPDKPFVIFSGDVNVHVYGTTFNFKAYDNTECVELLLLEGSVEMDISTNNRQKEIKVHPGEMLQFDRKTGEIELKSFNPLSFRGFHENSAIHFLNLRLSDILSDLERYFDSKIVLLDEVLADVRYFAYFTNNETLEQILNGINVDGKMRFFKKDGVIYISKK